MVETLNPPTSLPQTLLQAWERAVIASARLPRGTSRQAPLRELLQLVLKGEAKTVMNLWEIFTQERRELKRQLLANKREAIAYLLGFHLPNAARMHMTLERLATRTPLAEILKRSPGVWRWHDLGCGTGALAHAGISHLAKAGFDTRRLALNLSDGSGALLDMAQAVFKESAFDCDIKTRRLTLESLPPEKFAHSEGGSIYSLGYVWNELANNRAAQNKLMKIWQGHVDRNEPALIFMLEPATQDICRAAMQWRDTMVADGWHPLYPCPSATPCPMLERSRDWCYSEASWKRPRAISQLDQMLDLDRSQISATVFVLASPALAKLLALPKAAQVMVVGRPSHTDGPGFDYLVCDGTALDKRAPQRGSPLTLRGEPAPAPARQPQFIRQQQHNPSASKAPGRSAPQRSLRSETPTGRTWQQRSPLSDKRAPRKPARNSRKPR